MDVSGPKDIAVIIQPDGDKMAYLTTSLQLKNQTVTLVMDNLATSEVMKHNIVILNDSTKAMEVGMKALNAPDYLPEHPAIIMPPMADAGAKSQLFYSSKCCW